MKYVNAYWAGKSIVAYTRRSDGSSERWTFPAEHSFFVRTEDLNRKRSVSNNTLGKVLRESRIVRSLRDEGEYTRVVCHYEMRRGVREPSHLIAARWVEQEYEIFTYEADIQPVRRWIAENDVEIAKPFRAFFDIETDSRVPFSKKTDARILAFSLVGENGEVDAEALKEDSDEAEKELIKRMWKALSKYESIVSWNGDRFDFPIIEERTKRAGLSVETRRWLWLDHLLVFRRLNVAAASGEEKQSMALNSVAHNVLGVGKLDGMDGSRSYDEWLTNRNRLLDYCIRDSDLMRQIEEKTGFIALLQSLCEACNVFPDSKGLHPTAQVEGFLMRLGFERGHRFRTWFGFEETEKFKGAFVLDPKTNGIERNVHVADFSRLYPSIILTWNMSTETHKPNIRLIEETGFRPSYLSHLPPKRFPLPEGHCVSAYTETVFANEPRGLLPIALEEMIRLRKDWNAKKASLPPGTAEWVEADRKSTAYKVAANSFYGVVGSPFSRFFVRDVAEAVTQNGQWLIKETIEAAEARGMRVVYGDTDSIFVSGVTREAFSEFVEWCNRELYPGLLRSKSCIRNEIELAYEKAFDRIVFTSAKRYVGRYSHYKGTEATANSEPEIKGLEYKRGDVPRLARDLQYEAIKLLLSGNEPPPAVAFVPLLDAWKASVLNDELKPESVIQSKYLSKPLSQYARRTKKDGEYAAEPPHIAVARILKERGEDVGEGVKIDYYVSDASGASLQCKPASDWDGEFDRFYVWEVLVFPPTRRLLEAAFPGFDWNPWEKVRPRHTRRRNRGETALEGEGAVGSTGGGEKPKRRRLRRSMAGQLSLIDGGDNEASK